MFKFLFLQIFLFFLKNLFSEIFRAIRKIIKNFNNFKSSIAAVFLTVLISAPYLYLKLQNLSTIVGKIALKKDALILFDKIFIFNPLSGGYLLLISVIILTYLGIIYRKELGKHIWLIFLLSNALGAFFIIYNPILAKLSAKLITYTYFHRLGNLVYHELIIASFIGIIIFGISVKSRVNLDQKLKVLLIILVVTMTILTPLGFKRTYAFDKQENSAKSLTSYIRSNLPELSVFAADMWTGQRIPA